MDRSFKEIINDFQSRGSIADLKKCYTDLDPELYSNLNLSDPTTQQKLTLIINQYNALINVYLKNNDEYRLIQAQVYTIIAGLLTIAGALTSALKDNPYAYFGLVFIWIFTWLIRKPLVCSIHKNRFFHETTALYIRAIEDKLGLYNIPLRSKEFSDDFWEAFKNRDNINILKGGTGDKWGESIEKTFIILPILLTLLIFLTFNTMLSQLIEI